MEDKDLVKEILKDGNVNLYKEVVLVYSGGIFSKALSIVKREELAREITQQTFIRAYSKLDSFRVDCLGPWLHIIAMHISLDVINNERKSRSVSLDKAESIERDDYSEEREYMFEILERSICKLPYLEQHIIHLHYYKGLKIKDISNSLGLTNSNVLVKLHRIREKLKKEIQNERF